MPCDTATTQHAPAERLPDSEVRRQAADLARMPLLRVAFDTAPDVMLVLNRHRQIILANRACLNLLGAADGDAILGLRPGEALRCVHAHENDGGCGTTEFCQMCGAVNAILASQAGKADTQECHILCEPSGDALDLQVYATPFVLNDENYTIFAVVDRSHENRRRALERTFFHDVLNTAGGLKGAADLLNIIGPDEAAVFHEMIGRLSKRLIDEIQAQRQLMAAESNDLEVQSVPIISRDFLAEIQGLLASHEVAKDKQLVIAPDSDPAVFESDPTLLGRVIGNLVKNALEASEPGQTVTLGFQALGDEGAVEFRVHNPTFMPREVQLQLFQRSFSTKGRGRGLGTYSIKLLTDRYLKGSVRFTSTPEEGTVFIARYPMKLEPSKS